MHPNSRARNSITLRLCTSRVMVGVIMLVLGGLVAAVPALAQSTTRVSVGSGVQGNDQSYLPHISADGRFVAFQSLSTTLVANDTNLWPDIFVHDRQGGTTSRVSVGPNEVQANGPSANAAISADGRFVSFVSLASNLVTGDTNNLADIFVHDRQTGETTLASVGTGGVLGNGGSFVPDVSADGRFVAFVSEATNLVAGDTNGRLDVFVRDRQLGTTTRVSVGPGSGQANGDSIDPAISADGRFVAFASYASNLVSNDTGTLDVFLHDRSTGVTTRVSTGMGGTLADDASHDPDLSADGRIVAFQSVARNLVPGDNNAVSDVFAFDRLTGVMKRVGLNSVEPSVSGDGRFVAVQSAQQVYVTDLVTNASEPVSVVTNASGSVGKLGNASSAFAAISGDGRHTAFQSYATDLVTGDTNSTADIFVRDRGPVIQPTTDSDADGLTDLVEFHAGLDPAKAQLFFAEGSLQNIFETRYSVFNPNPLPVPVNVRFQPQGASVITDTFTLPAFGRRTIETSTYLPALVPRVGFATVFEAPVNIVADRTMTWDLDAAPRNYASHAETALRQPSTTWFLAEGSIIGTFRLFYLLQNPTPLPAAVTVRYLFANAPPCTTSPITLPAFSRHTIQVHVDVPAKCGVANRDVSAQISADIPINVERAMYLEGAGRPFFYAGHVAQGVVEPQASWRFAEGATGPFFDTFILLLNPDSTPVGVQLTFLRQDGTSVSITRVVPANSRRTYWLDVLTETDAGGAFVVPNEGGVSTLVDVLTPGGRVIAERAMWWPGPARGAFVPNPQPLWEEAHVSVGATTTAAAWGIADAEAQGSTRTATYALVANTSPYPTGLRVALLFTDANGIVTSYARDICLAANSRTTLAFPWEGDPGQGNCGLADDFASLFAEASTRKRFSVIVSAFGIGANPPGALVVERAQYSADQPPGTGWVNPFTGQFYQGPYWPAGSGALATPLVPAPVM